MSYASYNVRGKNYKLPFKAIRVDGLFHYFSLKKKSPLTTVFIFITNEVSGKIKKFNIKVRFLLDAFF